MNSFACLYKKREGYYMKKKLLVLLLTLAAVFALLTISVSAADIVDSGTCGENLTWTLDSDGVLTISGTGATGAMGNYMDSDNNRSPWYLYTDIDSATDINSAIIQSGVTSIGDYAFSDCWNLLHIEIPDSVTSIGEGAFEFCQNLNIINIPASVTTICNYTFDSCRSLMSVKIPESVTSIGEGAFGFCDSLTSLTIPESVTSIGEAAFCESYLESLTIPTGVTTIRNNTFSGCWNLKNVEIPASVTSIGDCAFEYCDSLMSITIPARVSSIGELAFVECISLTSVTIPASVTQIGDYAFSNCSALSDVYYGGTEEQWDRISIGSDCEELTSAAIHFEAAPAILASGEADGITWVLTSDGVLTISGAGAMGEYYDYSVPWAEYRESIVNVVIEPGITSIGKNSFSRCSNLESITIPEGVTSIGAYAFFNCDSLTDACIPEGVTAIGFAAFGKCSSLSSVVLPDSLTSIGEGAFEICSSLTSINIPNGVTSIGDSAFTYCTGLTNVKIPDTVTAIGRRTFNSCSSLASVKIPASVTSIEQGAFSNCENLTDVYFSGSNNQWNTVTIGDDNDPLRNATIHFAVSGPTIQTQPSSVSTTAGKTVTFKVVATGDGLTYQWQYSDDNGKTWLASSLKSATYSAKLTAEKDGRMVRCIVTDAAGNVVISDPAVMKISNLKITTQPKDYTGAVNSLAKITVTASGDGLTYQWQYSDDNGKTWLASSLKSATYSAKLTADKDGRQVRCVVTDKSGASVISSAAKMSVSGVTITTQPKDYVGAVNSTAKFTIAASGTGLTYQWQYSDDNGKTWLASSLKSTTYSAKLTADKNGRMVRCVVKDQYGNSAVSNAAKMALNGPAITTQPKDYTGAVNSTAKFTVAASGSGLTYQWQYSDDGGKTWLASSIKTATYSAKFTADKNNRMVRCIVTDASGNSVTSNAAKMTLTGPVINAQPQNYVGAVNSTAKFTVTATGDGLTFQWQYSDDNGATWLASSIKTATYSAKFTADKNGRMVRCIVTDANGNTVTSNAASMKLG